MGSPVQRKRFDETADKVIIKEGDNITLFIPNIVDEYPDMVTEGWTLADVTAFTKEYKLNLIVTDKNGNTIPDTKYADYNKTVVLEQSRPVGDAIIEGISLKIKINTVYEEPKPEETTEGD